MSSRILFQDTKPYEVVESLDNLRGPASGMIELPLYVRAMSREFRQVDLDNADERIAAYNDILQEGTLSDIVELVNTRLLIKDWLQQRLPRRVVDRWESRFSELRGAHRLGR